MEYIWVCGTSGVGKATFINRLLDEENSQLRTRMRINGGEELMAYGPDYHDDSLESLMQANCAHAIIKWQFRTHRKMKQLIQIKQEEGQRAIVLWRPLGAQIADLQRRSSWAIRDSVSTLQIDWNAMKRLMMKLSAETRLSVQILNASNAEYAVMNEWP
ncbi:MAG: hypothetical protein Q7S29_02315 [Candidatus Peribacter sp.]|nr:hypothetical protein [Candidatus Peribacter sp.]